MRMGLEVFCIRWVVKVGRAVHVQQPIVKAICDVAQEAVAIP